MSKQGKKNSGVTMRKILEVNDLSYSLPTNLSVINSRTYKKNFADSQSYSSTSGSSMNIRLQSSSDYVLGKNCYLRFDIRFDSDAKGDGAWFFNKTPASAIFQRLLHEDSSGSEISRVDELNKYVRNVLPWKYPLDYKGTVEMAGQAPDALLGAGVDPNNAFNCHGANLRVTIPLWYFDDFWKQDRMIPSALISGSIMKFTLANAQQAIQVQTAQAGADATNISYTITEPVVVLDSYQLAPMVQRQLLEQSQQGLEYVYETAYHQSATPSTANNFVLQINKAVSRASRVHTMTQNNEVANLVTKDNLGSVGYNVYQVQTRVGDLYFQQQVLQAGASNAQADTSKNCSEIYINNVSSLNKLGTTTSPPSVSLTEFRGGVATAGAGGDNNGSALIVQCLELSSALEYAGISINNSRTCEVRLEYSAGNVSKSIDSWLTYMKVCKSFPMRCVLKE